MDTVQNFTNNSDFLLPYMTKLFNQIMKYIKSPHLWEDKRTTVILGGKTDKQMDQLDSYQPIALFNQDANILTTVVASRMSVIIKDYVFSDQLGFLPQRQITDPIYRILNTIYISKKKETPLAIICRDAQKAFDHLEWDFIFGLLRKRNIEQYFMNAIQSIKNQKLEYK